MIRIALLSNPRSTGNQSLLPRVRSFCAQHPEIFHYEVERVDQIGPALHTIARVDPAVLVINGGDGTVQATLTELYHGGHFDHAPPPVAVLPNGKTNLIALDLGAAGDPIEALERVLEIARTGVEDHVVTRELIALTHEENGVGDGLRPVLGIRAAFLPERPAPIRVSLIRQGAIQGTFSLLIVTTLKKLLIGQRIGGESSAGVLQLMAVDQSPIAVVRAMLAGLFGKLGSGLLTGVYIRRGDEIRIDGDRSSVILDGEIFQAASGASIVLRPTDPLPFLRLAT